jgi:hypothetical protein
LDAPIVVLADRVEFSDVFDWSALAAGLLTDLPDKGLLNRLADLYDASRYSPLPLARFPPPFNEDDLPAADNNPRDTGDGM